MTCVNCSNTIENAMKLEYETKGLVSVQIALLTHKMRIVFDLSAYQQNQITPQMICDEVEMVGFGIELLEVIENNQEELLKQQFTSTNMSIDLNDEEGKTEKRNN